jgi:hypothetical protein
MIAPCILVTRDNIYLVFSAFTSRIISLLLSWSNVTDPYSSQINLSILDTVIPSLSSAVATFRNACSPELFASTRIVVGGDICADVSFLLKS